ncbi:hypothetical protein SAMN03159316_4133 [Pseudomonas sp. NFR02]|uniref:response regulator n=1 Tax=Pseudomonas sp. NFR02 TaxID=1566229 RepID=UPI00091D020B|nr:response regulator [Pseudomonas sp. NFR02]SFY22030.1 hypothetical protein SAMN03159316_4133 [Pseudomonas sp. NFR02]
MAARNFRVIIVDADPLQRLFIEKTLNGLGYFAILGLSSMKEAAAILSCVTPRFDLLIVNSLAILERGLNAAEFCRVHRFVTNAVCYGNFVPPFIVPSTYRELFSSKVISPCSIDTNTLRSLMQQFDGVTGQDGPNDKC